MDAQKSEKPPRGGLSEMVAGQFSGVFLPSL
jgi:hypothetical protein